MSRPHLADRSEQDRITLCPNCGSGDFHCNHIDEGPYREAARSARLLRDLGARQSAADLLTSLASVRILNFIRMKWVCADCGAQFDD
jgi:hypothetical protein